MTAARNIRADEVVEPLVPYHSEDGDFELCWTCHGYLVGPPETRLCDCPRPGAVSPAFAALRDALAQSYRRRWFRVLVPSLDSADEDDARAVWDGLWSAAREHAARRLAQRGLR